MEVDGIVSLYSEQNTAANCVHYMESCITYSMISPSFVSVRLFHQMAEIISTFIDIKCPTPIEQCAFVSAFLVKWNGILGIFEPNINGLK